MTEYKSERTNLYWLHLFDLSPLCVFKCSLKLPVWKDSKVHWLHLFDFSPLWVLRCWLEELGSEQAKYKLHLFCVFLLHLFKWVRYQSFIGCICLILFSVCFHMRYQSACQSGCIFTLVAFVWIFSTVIFQVGLQNNCSRGRNVTLAAYVLLWLFKLPVLEYA